MNIFQAFNIQYIPCIENTIEDFLAAIASTLAP